MVFAVSTSRHTAAAAVAETASLTFIPKKSGWDFHPNRFRASKLPAWSYIACSNAIVLFTGHLSGYLRNST